MILFQLLGLFLRSAPAKTERLISDLPQTSKYHNKKVETHVMKSPSTPIDFLDEWSVSIIPISKTFELRFTHPVIPKEGQEIDSITIEVNLAPHSDDVSFESVSSFSTSTNENETKWSVESAQTGPLTWYLKFKPPHSGITNQISDVLHRRATTAPTLTPAAPPPPTGSVIESFVFTVNSLDVSPCPIILIAEAHPTILGTLDKPLKTLQKGVKLTGDLKHPERRQTQAQQGKSKSKSAQSNEKVVKFLKAYRIGINGSDPRSIEQRDRKGKQKASGNAIASSSRATGDRVPAYNLPSVKHPAVVSNTAPLAPSQIQMTQMNPIIPTNQLQQQPVAPRQTSNTGHPYSLATTSVQQTQVRSKKEKKRTTKSKETSKSKTSKGKGRS